MVMFPTEKDLILRGQWPFYPILPMTRVPPRCVSLEAVECGLLLAGEWHRVYKGNLFFPRPATVATIRTYPYEEYADLDALLAAGWHGD